MKLGIEEEGGVGKYLGLPECFSGSKVETMGFIKENVESHMDKWYLRYLSQGGKEILLKTVASAVPIFAMSVFKLPKTVCSKLTSTMSSYWWDSSSFQKKTHWLSWEKLCIPKQYGGMGFRKVEGFNQAMLAKQAWKLVQDPKCLMVRLLKSRYHPSCDFLDATIGSRPSFAWRSVLFGRDLLMKGLKLNVGNGSSVKVWTDKWLDDGEIIRAPWIKNYSFDVNLKAKQLIDFGTKRWNKQALEEVFVPGDVALLLKQQPVCDKDDFWSWKHNKSGMYTVKSGYWLYSQLNKPECQIEAKTNPSVNSVKVKAWKVLSTPKIRNFIWKAMSEALPVSDLLQARGMIVDIRCQACGFEGESINHVLFSCTLARQTWAMTDIRSPPDGFHSSAIFVNFQYLFELDKQRCRNSDFKIWPWIIWFLWKNRNGLLFEGPHFSAKEMVAKAREEAEMWFLAQVGDREVELIDEIISPSVKVVWKTPPSGWTKCNIGFYRGKDKKVIGGSWVLRDCNGVVLLHSRRSFVDVNSKEEGEFLVMCWAIESLLSHGCKRVIIACPFGNLTDAIIRPKAWPSFQFEVSVLLGLCLGFEDWKCVVERAEANRGAFFIAQSVISLDFSQSYVKVGSPDWLAQFFDDEKLLASV